VRNLWYGEQPPRSLVRDSMQRFGANCFQMELGDCKCGRSTALLRGSSCSGVYQPMVRLSMFAADTGLYEVRTGKTVGLLAL
jgi:hypothetical protein